MRLQGYVVDGLARSAPLPTSMAGAPVAGAPTFPHSSAAPSFLHSSTASSFPHSSIAPSFLPTSVAPSFPHPNVAPLPAVGVQAFGIQPGRPSAPSGSVSQRDFNAAAKRFAEVLQQTGGSSGGMQHRLATPKEPWQPPKGTQRFQHYCYPMGTVLHTYKSICSEHSISISTSQFYGRLSLVGKVVDVMHAGCLMLLRFMFVIVASPLFRGFPVSSTGVGRGQSCLSHQPRPTLPAPGNACSLAYLCTTPRAGQGGAPPGM